MYIKGHYIQYKASQTWYLSGILYLVSPNPEVEHISHSFGWVEAEKFEAFRKTGNSLTGYTIPMNVPCAVLWVDSTTFIVL
jgi:hypothetical protein